MSIIHVQFSDETQTAIVSLFKLPENPEYWPNQGTVEGSDPRYMAFYDVLPDMVKHDWPVPDRAMEILLSSPRKL